jgi:hypothetical protein
MLLNTSTAQITLIIQLFDIAIAEYEYNSDTGYDASIIASITKEIIEATLEVSMSYIEVLNWKNLNNNSE